MANAALDGVRRRIRLELEQGRAIGFAGWRDSYHDDFTRSIPREKVVFTHSNAPPAYVGFIFFTKMVNSGLRGKISKGRSVIHVLLDPSDVRTMLKECSTLLAPRAAATPDAPHSNATDDVLDLLTSPQELAPMDQFVQAFQAEAAKSNGRVSSRVLKRLNDAHGTMSIYRLIKEGWIVAEKAPGKQKAGWYLAGATMVEHEKKASILPEDPLERARYLLGQKDGLKAEKERLEGQIAAVHAKLELIEKIAHAIGQLGALLKQ
jgi:hypothetical protein